MDMLTIKTVTREGLVEVLDALGDAAVEFSGREHVRNHSQWFIIDILCAEFDTPDYTRFLDVEYRRA